MTGLRVMPPLERENDARGRFTEWPGPDSHAAHRICADATASYASAARPDVARRADEAEMGATPRPDALVVAWAGAGFHNPHRPWGGRSRSNDPSREGCRAPRWSGADQRIGPASGSRLSPGQVGSPVVHEPARALEQVGAPIGPPRPCSGPHAQRTYAVHRRSDVHAIR